MEGSGCVRGRSCSRSSTRSRRSATVAHGRYRLANTNSIHGGSQFEGRRIDGDDVSVVKNPKRPEIGLLRSEMPFRPVLARVMSQFDSIGQYYIPTVGISSQIG